jgi:hypothetical protein
MKYLVHMGPDQSMNLPWHHGPSMPLPLVHSVWVHDFEMLAHHDMPCPVCFERPALYERDMTPGRYREQFRPCEECEAKGWRLHKSPLVLTLAYLRALFR